MRRLLLLLLFTLVSSARGSTAACTGLCLQQVTCNGSETTSISGVVYAPNGVDPLPNVLVFIPNSVPQPFTPGVQCTAPGAPPSGSPLVGATSGVDGSFKLVNVPVGTNIPIVIQAGRWRRQLTVATTTACTDTPFSARMPKNQSEGDIPLIAIATGNSDSVECVLRKVGLDDTEFTNPLATGRIHLYSGSGAAGAKIDANTPSQDALMSDAAELAKYDVVMLPCQGTPARQGANAGSSAGLGNLLNYANSGGRIYASHYSDSWFLNNGSFATVAAWPAASDSAAGGSGTAVINTDFSGGRILSDWLQGIGATTTPGQIAVNAYSSVIKSVNPAQAQLWLTLNGASSSVQQFTFNTPVGATNQCGRVLFNEYHVEVPSTAPMGKAFPAECTGAAMTNQEKLLEYSLFDLTNSGGAATLTPASGDFGGQALGFATAGQTFTWTNNSIFNAGVSSVTASSDYMVTGNTCSNNIAPGASCKITVAYKPKVAGAANGTLQVNSNSGILTAALTGVGTPDVTASTANLAYPSTDVGAPSSSSFTVRNVAPGPISVGQIPTSGDFAASNDCGVSLAVGATCTVTVVFTPTATGSRSGTVTVGGAQTTAVGNGVDFTVATMQASGSVIAGDSASFPFSLTPVAGYSAAVRLTCSIDAPGSTCTINQASAVPNGGSLTATVTTTSKYTIIGYSGVGRGWLGFVTLVVMGGIFARRRSRLSALCIVTAMVMATGGLTTGCSGKLPAQNAAYTSAGTYGVNVTATDGFLKHSATYSMRVTVN